MDQSAGSAVAATVVIWAVSSGLALALGVLLLGGSGAPRRWIRTAARSIVHLSRGVPTSLLVLGTGLAMLRIGPHTLPRIFPGTPARFQAVAWGAAAAVALGGSGHFAEIFRAARGAIGASRLDQATLLGFSPVRRWLLVARETAVVALPPTGARLVHQLHNTAFVAFFPVADLFGWVQSESSATFAVLDVVVLGGALYVMLSLLIWLAARVLELLLACRPPRVRALAGAA